MALRPAKLSVSLFRHPCRKPLSPVKGWVCLVGFASCKALLHTQPGIRAWGEYGDWRPCDLPWGYAPNPIFINDRSLSTV